MKRRMLGRTELSIPEIGFGCGPTAGLMIRESARTQREAVAHALDLGIDYFDTAPGYGEAISEANLGRTLRELRAQPVIATKVELFSADLADGADGIARAIVRSVEASLLRLHVPCIDVIQLHNRIGLERAAHSELGRGALLSVEDVLGEHGVIAAFDVLRRAGKVRFFGCSAFGGEPAALASVIDSDAFDVVMLHYSMLNRSAWRSGSHAGARRDYARIGARASARGMGTIALRVLEGGVLSDSNVSAASAHPATTTRQELDAAATRLRAHLDEREPLSVLATRFALSNPDVSTVLVGFSSVEQIDEAASSAAAGPLPDGLLGRLDAALETPGSDAEGGSPN